MNPKQMRALADAAGNLTRDNDWDNETITDVMTALRAAANQLEAVHAALVRHPTCDKYDEDDVVSCGWKSAVRDITWAVNGKAGAL